MEIHPSATLDGATRAGIHRATEKALLTTHIGNGPTQIFMVGDDGEGTRLAITAVVKHEDVLVVHAAEAGPDYLALLDDLIQPEAAAEPEPGSAGTSADGLLLRELLVLELFAAADLGYDVDRLSHRTRPGRPAPLTVGTVVRLGFDAPLWDAVTKAAAAEDQSVADYVTAVLQA